MAQQMITLEEAAARLNISPEEMKKRLKTDPDFKRLSQIRDGSSVRFKASAIDELGRQLGLASDDGLALPPMTDDVPPGSDDFKVPTADRKPKPPADEPLDFGSTDDEVFSLADDVKPASPRSSGKLTPGKPAKPAKPMSDSSQSSADSDVRLDTGRPKKPPAGDDESAIPTEEIALDFSGPGSAVIRGGSSSKLSAPRTTGSSGNLNPKKGAPGDESGSSEFELSLDADSDEFLDPAGDGDEVDLGSMPKGKPGSSRRGAASASGINLSDPADSGISLEKGKGPATSRNKIKTPPADDSDESDVDFELSLDSSAVASSTKLGAPKSGKLVLDSDSDSEFELTLDDSEGSLEQAALESDAEDKGDIFETDFEIPQMPDESASEAVALESDTDLEKDDFELDDSEVSVDEESGSEVALLDDDEEGAPKAKKGKAKKKAVADDDVDVDVDLADEPDDEGSVSKALKGAKGKKRTDDDDEAVPAGAGAPTKPWGIVPALFLAPALLFTLLGALMGYELLHTMWGYQQPRKPTAPIVRAIASQFDMELRDQ